MCHFLSLEHSPPCAVFIFATFSPAFMLSFSYLFHYFFQEGSVTSTIFLIWNLSFFPLAGQCARNKCLPSFLLLSAFWSKHFHVSL